MKPRRWSWLLLGAALIVAVTCVAFAPGPSRSPRWSFLTGRAPDSSETEETGWDADLKWAGEDPVIADPDLLRNGPAKVDRWAQYQVPLDFEVVAAEARREALQSGGKELETYPRQFKAIGQGWTIEVWPQVAADGTVGTLVRVSLHYGEGCYGVVARWLRGLLRRD